MGQNRTSDKKNQKRKTPSFEKVFDNRNRRVCGLWIRNSIFYAQITVPTIHGSKKTRRVRLEGRTLAQARDELQKLRFLRQDNQMPAMVQTPHLKEYGEHYLQTQWDLGRKTAGTIQSEQAHVRFWADHLGHVRLKNITPSLIQSGLIERRARGASKRTVNISQTVLRNTLNLAIQEGYITTLPFNGIKWNRVPQVAASRQVNISGELF